MTKLDRITNKEHLTGVMKRPRLIFEMDEEFVSNKL